MSKRIYMNCQHASATEVLDAGKVYVVSDDLAEALLAEGSGADGKPAARLAKAKEGLKAKRPTKPDPGESEPLVDEDEDEKEDEDE